MAYISDLRCRKWYVSEISRIHRRTDDPNTRLERDLGLHETVVAGPFDTEDEAEEYRAGLPHPDKYEVWHYQPLETARNEFRRFVDWMRPFPSAAMSLYGSDMPDHSFRTVTRSEMFDAFFRKYPQYDCYREELSEILPELSRFDVREDRWRGVDLSGQ